MGLYLGSQRIGNLGETFTPREIQSVNGKTSVQGNITVYGSDVQVSQNDTRTVEAALSDVSRIDLKDYYKKTETSSAVQIQNAFDNIDMSEYYKKNETSSATQIQNAFDNIDFSNYYMKSETSSNSQLQTKFSGIYGKNETSSASQIEERFGNYYMKDELSTCISAAVEVLLNEMLNTEYENILKEKF